MTAIVQHVRHSDTQEVERLNSLALDLQWSWSHSADALWRQIDPELWSLTRNPWVIMQTVSRTRLRALADDRQFRERLDALVRRQQQHVDAPSWFQQHHARTPLTTVAYFAMEFMLSEALPIYSGGLGNVAGDHLKAASDLGVPIVGVGLLYQQGYFRQLLTADGAQRALYPFNDPMQLPITPVRDAGGEWVRVKLALPGSQLWLRAWHVRVGRATLYLLDSNDPANTPADRSLVSELYGGGAEVRLVQELLLGIGGWRLLTTLGINPEVCHLNEGHAAFAVVERARACQERHGLPFRAALSVTRAGNVFTTHTPVLAGFDRFEPGLVAHYLTAYAEEELGISVQELLALGREQPADRSEPFNMAYLAVRGSGAVNGVSRLHGEMSRRIFRPLFPRWPEPEVPIGHVTNGIHVPSWDSPESDALWTEACGPDRWRGSMDVVEHGLRQTPDAALWRMRGAARDRLVRDARRRLVQQLTAAGATADEREQAAHVFDPNTLTLGFARRFATYKRPHLLLHDPARLARILTNANRPVQIVVAGKAHPQDDAGRAMVQEWTRFVRQPHVRAHAMFLGDYDMRLTETLVQGVDVWLNTPRRPWEASGTSGMKVLVNGGLNLSELDGWWAEAYAPGVGWSLGEGVDELDEPSRDAADAESLYTLLEETIAPLFYTRNAHGVPEAWVARMRESMATLTPRFSANRAVREYTDDYYAHAAIAYRSRSANEGVDGVGVDAWREGLRERWPSMRFGDVSVSADAGEYVVEVQAYLGDVEPGAIRLELYAEPVGSEPRECVHPMAYTEALVGCVNAHLFTARVPADRPPSDYTPRIVPYRQGARVPLEAPFVLWRDR